jgi:signal peptidase II
MAFGTTLGDGVWAKYILSVFRLAAIVGIAVYIKRLIVDPKTTLTFLVTIALIFAGAAGNLIDGMFYDIWFGIDPDLSSNFIKNEFGMPVYGADGEIVLREGGFLLGSVVDMFQFTLTWPSWMPEGYAGTDIFPFIFNVADASISIGVALIILKYRHFFRKKTKENEPKENNDSVIIS